MLQGLRLARYRFSLKSTSRIELNSFIGSTLRGAFGGVFRQLVCVTHAPVCDDCLLRNQCAYGYVFETTPPTDSAKLRNLSDISRPFVIEPPMQFAVTSDQLPVTANASVRRHPSSLIPHPSSLITFAPGDEFSFNLLLVGRAIDYLPYFIFVFRELEKHGLGRGRKEGQGQFQLHQVTALLPDGTKGEIRKAEGGTKGERRKGKGENFALRPSPFDFEAVIYDRARDQLTDADATITAQHLLTRANQLSQLSQPPNHPTTQLTLHFLTPTRIKFGGHLTSDFQFHHLIRALLRRLSGLMYFHCGSELQVDFRGLIQLAEKIEKVSDTLRWQEQTRYSARQKTEMQMGGFVGSVTFAGDLTPFLPLLVAGEFVHVGKGTVMGLGKYRISDQ